MSNTPVPMTRVLDESGNEVLRGWYFKYPRYNDNPWGRDPDKPREMVEGVLICDEGDWGLENHFRLTRVMAPHTIEVANDD